MINDCDLFVSGLLPSHGRLSDGEFGNGGGHRRRSGRRAAAGRHLRLLSLPRHRQRLHQMKLRLVHFHFSRKFPSPPPLLLLLLLLLPFHLRDLSRRFQDLLPPPRPPVTPHSSRFLRLLSRFQTHFASNSIKFHASLLL